MSRIDVGLWAVVFGAQLVLAATGCSGDDPAAPPTHKRSGTSGGNGSGGASSSGTAGGDNSGGGTSTSSAGNTSSSSGSPGTELTCKSYTWCQSYSVTKWQGQTLPQPNGGMIENGLYREAYVLSSNGTGTDFGDYPDAFLFQDGWFRHLGSLGSVGKFSTTAGNPAELSFVDSEYCDDQSGAVTKPSSNQYQVPYFVDAQGYLFLFVDEWTVAAYKKVQSLCEGPTAVPSAPGDSYVCEVANCGCTEAANGPADAQTCMYVNTGQ